MEEKNFPTPKYTASRQLIVRTLVRYVIRRITQTFAMMYDFPSPVLVSLGFSEPASGAIRNQPIAAQLGVDTSQMHRHHGQTP